VIGLLRINTPRVALGMALTPILSELAWKHPRLTVEVYSDDALVDIVAQGFDAGIRLGEAVQQDMIAVRLIQPFKVILVAAPEYLDAKGVPKSTGALSLPLTIARVEPKQPWWCRSAGSDEFAPSKENLHLPLPCEARANRGSIALPQACGPYPWRGCQIGCCTAKSRPLRRRVYGRDGS
jgi:DNA-binding transcriptional LysR family regulator